MELNIYDSTLREGMQTPGGIGGNLEERIYAANLISQFADWLELGMPANDVDYGIIKGIKDSFIENERDAGIAVLCRLKEDDIDKAAEVIGDYHSTLAHVFIGTSEEHRKNRFKGKWSKNAYVKNIREVVKYAAEKEFSRIMFSPEDAYRTFANPNTKEDFFDFVDAAIDGYNSNAGNKEKLILNFPDTVGYSTISEFESLLDEIIEKYGNTIEISIHCHNDTSASNQQAIEMYMRDKANWIQTTFGGLGERNGIASTETVIAALNERSLLKGKKYNRPDVLRKLEPYTHHILAALGRIVPYNQPTCGSGSSTSTAGAHTQIAEKDASTYHIHGKKYGATPIIEFGPTSGTNQIIPILAKLDIPLDKSNEKVISFTNKMKDKCNSEKRTLPETDIMYHIIHFFSEMKDPLTVTDYTVDTSKDKNPKVTLSGIYNNKPFSQSCEDKGSLEAIIGALNSVLEGDGNCAKLESFEPQVVPKIPEQYLHWDEGKYPDIPDGLDIHSELRAVVGIHNNENGTVYYGVDTGEDTFQTIANSVIDAFTKMETINKYETKFLD